MIIAKWMQEDYDGGVVVITMPFDSKEGAQERIDELRKNARDLGKYFRLIFLKEVPS